MRRVMLSPGSCARHAAAAPGSGALPRILPGCDDAVAALYTAHYRSLVRMAALLADDAALAEDVVQDSFAAMHDAWPRLRATDQALLYLRRAVINRTRSALRRRAAADHYLPHAWVPDTSDTEESAPERRQRPAVLWALGTLPHPQREALVLRYYADLTARQTAAAMSVSEGSARTHLSRGLASLRAILDEPAPSAEVPDGCVTAAKTDSRTYSPALK